MKPDSELYRLVRSTRERARALRQFARERRHRAEDLLSRAGRLCNRYRKSGSAEPKLPSQPVRQVRQTIHSRNLEVVQELRNALTDLETIRMTPAGDSELRQLKEEIRKTIAESAKR